MAIPAFFNTIGAKLPPDRYLKSPLRSAYDLAIIIHPKPQPNTRTSSHPSPHATLETPPPRVFYIRSMPHPALHTTQPTPAPQGFRDALAELVQIGLKVARMVGQNADAETNLAEAAAQAGAAEGASPLATSLAEAIEADRAATAAAESRQTVTARTTAVAHAYARTSRAIRLTILLAERLDRGWARNNTADDRLTMAKRQIARGVKDAIARETEGEQAHDLTAALTERLEALDTEDEFNDRAPEQIIAMICRDLGLDPARMTMRPPVPHTTSQPAATHDTPLTVQIRNEKPHPPQRRPDG